VGGWVGGGYVVTLDTFQNKMEGLLWSGYYKMSGWASLGPFPKTVARSSAGPLPKRCGGSPGPFLFFVVARAGGGTFTGPARQY